MTGMTFKRIKNRFIAFLNACGGAAAVEFALILPFMLTLYVGSNEASQLYIVDRRVTTVSGVVGDLVARSRNAISNTELQNYFAAANAIMRPYATAGLKQVVTLVEVSSTGTTKVIWSCGYNGGVRKTANATYPLPAEMIAISKGQYVVVSSASYSYLPLYGMVFKTAINMYHENFYSPRFDAQIASPGCTS